MNFKDEVLTIRKYKIGWSDGNRKRDYYLWGKDADDAFFNIARKIDPKVNTTQWTGEERQITEKEYRILVNNQLAGWMIL